MLLGGKVKSEIPIYTNLAKFMLGLLRFWKGGAYVCIEKIEMDQDGCAVGGCGVSIRPA